MASACASNYGSISGLRVPDQVFVWTLCIGSVASYCILCVLLMSSFSNQFVRRIGGRDADDIEGRDRRRFRDSDYIRNRRCGELDGIYAINSQMKSPVSIFGIDIGDENALNLALSHKLVTPWTSRIVVADGVNPKQEGDPTADPTSAPSNEPTGYPTGYLSVGGHRSSLQQMK